VRTLVAAEPGTPGHDNEDVAVFGQGMFVVADGLTARTDTGCSHGVAWFANELSTAVLTHSDLGPRGALAAAIRDTAALHCDTCDLQHPATPCAAVAIVHITEQFVRYLVLGDVTVVIDVGRAMAISDPRITRTARAERHAADALPADAPGKAEALLRMKRAELADRNTDAGYWIAGADPTVVDHAVSGEVPRSAVQRVAILTDGAARVVETFKLYDWAGVLDALATSGPVELIALVRDTERADPDTTKWPRNKVSDDAAVIYCDGISP